MSSEGYHEPIELVSERTREMHRGIVSLIEELEAIDWYQQRADACTDGELKAVLLHHRDEEVEHALMNLEWLRRNSPEFARNARIYLFTEGPITEIEAGAEAGEAGKGPSTGGSLGIGSLRPREGL
jgi:ferritin-like protein